MSSVSLCHLSTLPFTVAPQTRQIMCQCLNVDHARIVMILQGLSHPTSIKYLSVRQICRKSIVVINIVLLVKCMKIPIFLQFGLVQNLFIKRLGLCTPPIIFLSFTPHDMAFFKVFEFGYYILINSKAKVDVFDSYCSLR